MTDAPKKPRRPNGKADRAARRAKWDADVADLLARRYGVQPLGPDIPAALDLAFRTQRSPQVTVDQLGKRFDLVELESWQAAKA